MLLIDTHTLLWWIKAHKRLGEQARQSIEEAWDTEGLAVSSVTFWEMAMLQKKGQVNLRRPVDVMYRELTQDGLIDIAVSGEIGIRAVSLPDFHKDPADRLIVATALEGDHQLVTADRKILAWAGPLRCVPAGV